MSHLLSIAVALACVRPAGAEELQQLQKVGPVIQAATARTLMRAAVRKYGKQMGALTAKIDFATKVCGDDFPCFINQRLNPAYWTLVDASMGVYSLNERKNASEAVKDILTHPDKYKIECATAIKLVLHQALLETIGAERYDRAAAGLRIGSGPYEGVLKTVMVRESASGRPADKFPGIAAGDFVGTLQTGDGVYMVNLRPKPGSQAGGWGGENALSLGEGRFYGHPIGEAAGQAIVDKLKENWDPTPGPGRFGEANREPWWVNEFYRPSGEAIRDLGR